METFWNPFALSLKLAFFSTLLTFLVAIFFSFLYVFSKKWQKISLMTVLNLPLVLPPTVLGFYFLILFQPENLFSYWVEQILHIRLLFSFEGLLLAFTILGLPFMLNPMWLAFNDLPPQYLETALTLGKNKWTIYWRVLLPNIKNAIRTGIVLTFAHSLGEFGVVLMIGGSIPEETRLVSIAIYQALENLDYTTAYLYSALMLGFAIFFMFLLFYRKKIY